MQYDDKTKLVLSYETTNKFGEVETREIVKSFNAINAPNVTELGELFLDFARLIGFSYLTDFEFKTDNDEDEFNISNDSMNFSFSTDGSGDTTIYTTTTER